MKKKTAITALLLVLVALLGLIGRASAQENGNLLPSLTAENSPYGRIYSDFVYCPGENGMPCSWQAKTFGLVRDAASWHPLFIHTFDDEHTNVVVVNGRDQFDKNIMSPVLTFSPMQVMRGQKYEFRADLVDVCCNDGLRIDRNAGVRFGLILPSGEFKLLAGVSAGNEWATVRSHYTPDFDGVVALAVVNTTWAWDNNDFAISNLYFGSECKEDGHGHGRKDGDRDNTPRPGKYRR